MADLIAALRAREDAEVDRLAAAARSLGIGAISATTLAASQKALAVAAELSGTDAINTAASDLRALRIDPALQRAQARDLDAFAAGLPDLIAGWLAAGWTTEAEGQAEIIHEQGSGLRVTVSLSKQDRADLADYPIQGHSPAEIAAHLARTLRYELEGAIAQCLISTSPAAVMAAIGQAGEANGNRLSQVARNAYLSGTQAARVDIAAALTGGA